MRLLYLPLYTNKNLNGDSSYNIAKKFIRNAVERGWYVHWVLPQVGGRSRFHYAGGRDPIENHPQVLVHRVASVEDQYIQTGVVPADWLYKTFSQHEGRYHIDAVLTEKPASANYVRKLLQHPFTRPAKKRGRFLGKTPVLPVFVRDPFTKSTDVHIISDVEELEQAVGYLLNHAVFMCQPDFEKAMDGARRYLNYGQVKRFAERAVVIPPGTATDELVRIREETPKRERFSILIAERMKNGTKMDVLDAADYLFASGRPVDVVISSQGDVNKMTLMNYPTVFEHAELYPMNPREKYLPLAASCHAVITMPATHSYPQGLMEQLSLGLVAVLPDFPWVDSVLPNYPFKVQRNKKSMVAMLEWVQDNYEEACARIAWVPGYIAEHYESRMMTDATLGHIEQTVRKAWASMTPVGGYVELLEELEADEVDEDELYAFLNAHSVTGLTFENEHKTASFGNYRSHLFHAMRSAGWVDKCDGPFVTMRRGDDGRHV